MKSEVIEANYDEITEQMGGVPIVMFPFRLSTNRAHYIKTVIKYVTEKMESFKSLRVDLLFVWGIPESVCRAISGDIVRRISVQQIAGAENLHIHGQGNIDEDFLDELERDFPVIRL